MKNVRLIRLALLTITLVGALIAIVPSAWAVIDYGSGTGTRVFTSPVAAVANYEGTWGSFLGTPINSYYFISAKHINGAFGAGVGSTFNINSTNYTVSAQYDSPSSDLTVWGVNPSGSAFSSGNIAPLYPLYNGLSPNVETNKSMVVTGRGTDVGSQVLVGATLKGWQWGTSDGLQSWGTNTVSQIVNGGTGLGSLLRFAFDSSGGFNEGTLSVGDSGGAVFIQDPSDSVWKLAGINYGVEATFSFNSNGSPSFNAAIFDRSGLYELESSGWVAESGAASAYSTRIGSNDAWINSITGSPIWNGAAGNGNWSPGTNWSTAPANGNNLVFSGTTQTSTSNNSLTSVGAITFDGTAGAFSLSGNALTAAGGITNFSASTQTVNLNLTLSAAQQFGAFGGGGLTINGTVANGGNALTLNGPSNMTLAGVISGTGSLTKEGTGTATLSANNTYSGNTTVNNGTLVAGHVHGLGNGGLTINNTAKTTLQSGLSAPVQLTSLIMQGGTSPTGTFDVTNNNLIVHNGNLTNLTADIKHGLNISGAAWTGSGITSSTAAADGSGLTAVGIMSNDDGSGGTIYGTWPVGADAGGAVSVTNTDVLVKYTYFGDADLDGQVGNGTDYLLWSTGFSNNLTGWLFGDFDYSGAVGNGTDYLLWQTGFSNQGAPLIGGGGVQPVPEPSTLVLTILGLAGVTAGQIRRRTKPAAG